MVQRLATEQPDVATQVEALENSEKNLKKTEQTTILLDEERRRNATLKAHREGKMQRKSRACFASHDECGLCARELSVMNNQLARLRPHGTLPALLGTARQSLPTELKADGSHLGIPIRIARTDSIHSTIDHGAPDRSAVCRKRPTLDEEA